MLVRFFYLSSLWLVIAFLLTLWLGTRVRRSGFLSSLMYLVFVLSGADVIALGWFGEPNEVFLESILAFWVAIPVLIFLRNWNAPAQTFYLFALLTTALYLLYAFAVTTFTPLSPLAFVFSFLLFILETFALLLSLTYAFEVLDVLCRVRWRRLAAKVPHADHAPMVSLHVPAYNEPPELVEQTLRALAQLDYPRFEVILVDNNTPREDAWQPLVRVCRELGFKCLHLEKWPGYKSGALNFALSMTDPNAQIIGVVDADYIVQPDFLKKTVSYFSDPQIAFVQTPQDYRDYARNRFFQAAYDGYKYFFALSMPARNERNAIIFCGTMGLLRKSVLQEIGGWDEWCITEDAEASLRILNRGYQSLYVNQTFGRGLMPLNFEGLKKQRFRWTFGGVQILKKHWGKLMPWARWVDPQNQLTGAQRYFYLVAGLQWFNELITFAFTIVVIISLLLIVTGQTELLRPTTEAFVILPLVLIGTNMLRALWGLRNALGLSWSRAYHALTLWFALTWVVTLACVQAIVRQRGVFLRTPKVLTDRAWLRALRITSWESTLAAMCFVGGLVVLWRAPSWLSLALFGLCCSQALIYVSAPSHSLLSLAGANGRAMEPDRGAIGESYVNENRIGVQLGIVALILLFVAVAASFLPTRNTKPWWSIFQPQPVIAPRFELPKVPPGQEKKPTPKRETETPLPSPPLTALLTVTPLATLTLTPTPALTSSVTPSPTLLPSRTWTPTALATATFPPTAVPSFTSIPATATTAFTSTRQPTAPPCPTPTSTPTPLANTTPRPTPSQSPTPLC